MSLFKLFTKFRSYAFDLVGNIFLGGNELKFGEKYHQNFCEKSSDLYLMKYFNETSQFGQKYHQTFDLNLVKNITKLQKYLKKLFK